MGSGNPTAGPSGAISYRILQGLSVGFGGRLCIDFDDFTGRSPQGDDAVTPLLDTRSYTQPCLLTQSLSQGTCTSRPIMAW
jgi:hypothetical protein